MYVPCRPLCTYADLCAKVLPLPSVYRQNSLAGQIAFEHIFSMRKVRQFETNQNISYYILENPQLNFAYYINADGISETGA